MRASPNAVFCCLLAVALCAGCGSSSSSDVDILDPQTSHYGKTYTELVGDWIAYIYRMAPPECFNAALDGSGKNCPLYQDPASPVFFLVGNFGGVTKRTECAVPKGKALFFPIVNVWGDNAGVPADKVLPESELKAYADSTFVTYDTSTLMLEVDGQQVPRSSLQRGAIISRYVVSLTAGQTPFDCMGISGVEGDFPGYQAGYWAMLAPLAAGAHTLKFGARVKSETPANDITIDAEYAFTIE